MANLTSISNLSPDFKEIARLKTENEALKKEVQQLRILVQNISSPTVETQAEPLSDEEMLCIKQIADLKKLSEDRELTLEEAKKADIYVKMLVAIRNKPKKQNDDSKEYSVNELLQNLEP